MSTYTNITIDQNTGVGSGEIDGILFNSVNLADGFKPISQPKISPVNSIFNPSGNQTNKALIINAVDIDWNGAQVNNHTINSTGDILTVVKDTENTAEAASANYNNLANWAKQQDKPTYTANEVGALATNATIPVSQGKRGDR